MKTKRIDRLSSCATWVAVICLITLYVLRHVHPISYFNNLQIHKVSVSDLDGGKARLPMTRWVETTGTVSEIEVWEHCQRIASRSLGDYNIWLFYVVRDGDKAILVREQLDRRVSEDECDARGLRMMRMREFKRVPGDRVQILKYEGKDDHHIIGLPEKVKVRGMLRYKVYAKFPDEFGQNRKVSWKTPFMEYGEEPWYLPTLIFYIMVLAFVYMLSMQMKYGADDFIKVKCRLDPDKTEFSPGEDFKFLMDVTINKPNVNVNNLEAVLRATRLVFMSTKVLHEDIRTLEAHTLSTEGTTKTFEVAFHIPGGPGELTTKHKKIFDKETEWRVMCRLDLEGYMTHEAEKQIYIEKK